MRKFSLLAFGGNGPVHGCQLARSLGMKEVIVPANPGLFSAMGLGQPATNSDMAGEKRDAA